MYVPGLFPDGTSGAPWLARRLHGRTERNPQSGATRRV